MGKEDEPRAYKGEQQPAGGAGTPDLPAELAAFLAEQRYACVTQATDQGTVFVVKAPAADIESLRGPVPIEQRHELYRHPNAPVIRLLTTIYDQPDWPLKLETFINVGNPEQRADLAALAEQEELVLLFYDEALRHRLSKCVRTVEAAAITTLLAEVEALHAAIPPEQFDFDRAKAAVMARTRL